MSNEIPQNDIDASLQRALALDAQMPRGIAIDTGLQSAKTANVASGSAFRSVA